jgi:hypothetical protein
MKTINYCRHVKEDGIPCGSPPLRGENYCYFHLRYKGYPLRRRNSHGLGGLRFTRGMAFNLKALQASLKRVERRLASGRCPDPESARTIRHALQMAISTLRYEENGEIREPDSGRQPLASSAKSNKRYILR